MSEVVREGDRLNLSLVSWGKQGEALASLSGRDVRVSGGIPGDEVVAEVVRCRSEYIAARVVEVLSPSPHRVSAPCQYFWPCTGCQWQHVKYGHQLDIKRQIVMDAIREVDGLDVGLVLPTLGSPKEYGYRNHARFTVGRRKGELGFVSQESRRFVHVQECLLMHPRINDALAQLQGRCRETSQLSIRYGVNTDDFLIQPALKTPAVTLPSGQKHYRERIDGREFRVAGSSFFQVNTEQAARMAEMVKDELRLSGNEVIVDAYAGVGTFAVLMASHAGRVIAIEESTSAVKDAKVNAQGLDGIEFLEGKTEDVLARIEDRPDGVILDPPRAGCHPAALDALKRLRPRRVVYVSCEPDTLARDLKILCQGPFSLERVQPIDMFPQTHHVECIATLVRNENGDTPGECAGTGGGRGTAAIVLASTSPEGVSS